MFVDVSYIHLRVGEKKYYVTEYWKSQINAGNEV